MGGRQALTGAAAVWVGVALVGCGPELPSAEVVAAAGSEARREAVALEESRSGRRPEFGPFDPTWRVPAEFHPYEEPRTVRAPSTTGELMTVEVPGTVEFRLADAAVSFQVLAVDGPEGRVVEVPFRAPHSGGGPAVERTIRVRTTPADLAWLDFNAAVVLTRQAATSGESPSSASAGSPLPPRQNWLDRPVPAGESGVSESISKQQKYKN